MSVFTSSTIDFDLSIAANYHAFWGAFVDVKIQALGGWTYVAQTGDGDPSVVAPGTTGTYACFRVYSCVVGSTTWYMRLDMGWDANGPKVKFQVGTTVNGSGVLGGQTSTQIISNSGAGTAGGPVRTCYISSDVGRLMLQAGLGTNNGTWMGFSIHGNVDVNGGLVSGMEVFFFADTTNNCSSQYVPATGTVPAKKLYWPCNFGTEADQSIGGVLVKGHPMLWDGVACNNATLAVAEFPSTNYAATFVTTCTLYGQTRSFLVNGAFNISVGNANVSAGFRYE